MLKSLNCSYSIFTLLFSPVLLYGSCEYLFPNITACCPLTFIAFLTMPWIILLNFCDEILAFYNNKRSYFKGKNSIEESDCVNNTQESDLLSSQLSRGVLKPILKQKTFNLGEDLDTYEKNLQAYLIHQAEKYRTDTITVSIKNKTTCRFILPFKNILAAIKQPHMDSGLKVFLEPIFSLPQRKESLFNCESKLFLSEEGTFLNLSSEDTKFSKGNYGSLLFLIFSKSVMLIREKIIFFPQFSPIIFDIPHSIFDYPKLIQHLFDYLGHREFPLHRFLWRIPENVLISHPSIVQRIHELGCHFVIKTTYPRVEASWNYIQIDEVSLQKLIENQAHRQNSQILESFLNQPGKIIVSGLNHLQSYMHFDFAYGEAFSKAKLLESITSEHNHDFSETA